MLYEREVTTKSRFVVATVIVGAFAGAVGAHLLVGGSSAIDVLLLVVLLVGLRVAARSVKR